jgi:hypothetical protein
MNELIASSTWVGSNPYMLVIEPKDRTIDPLIIDLDVSGWMTTHAPYLRIAANWYLLPKKPVTPLARLSMIVMNGEQPYYTARHVGIAGSGGSNEIVAYGIGKKQLNGTTMQMWCMPNGTVCGGDDVDALSIAAVRRLGPRG